jgi:hypothetical protein
MICNNDGKNFMSEQFRSETLVQCLIIVILKRKKKDLKKNNSILLLYHNDTENQSC